MKLLIPNYTFDASAKTVTLTDYVTVRLDRLYLIINVTDNLIIYNLANGDIGATVATNVVTLEYDTTSMDDADKLEIFYDDPNVTAATNETLATILTTSDFDTKTGSLTETAPATDTASSGVNGRLQRIAQRITSLIALLPTSLGQKVSASSFPVIVASDQSTIPVSLVSIPLPSGGSTSANQTTEIASLSSIDTKLTDVATQTTLALIKAKTDNLDTALSGIKTGTDKIITAPATAANQATEISSLGSIDGKITAVNTGAVVISSSALPSGASTSAKQDTGNTSLSSIDGKITAVNTGAVVVSSSALPSGAATAANQSTAGTSLGNIDTNAGTTADSIVAAGATGSISAKLRRLTQGVEDLKTLTVLGSGSAVIGKVGIDQTTPGTTNAIYRVKKDTYAASAAFTITLASLASSTTGVGRQSTIITGNVAESALITVKFTVGTTPTINTNILVYLIRGDDTYLDDAAGTSDAGFTVINASLLGAILVNAVTSNIAYYGVFDTKFLGSLGPKFGIAIINASGVTANSTGGNFDVRYTLIS